MKQPNYKWFAVGGLLLSMASLFAIALAGRLPFSAVLVLLCLTSLGIGASFPISTIAIQNATRRNLVGLVTGSAQYFRYLTCSVAVAACGTTLLLGLGFSTATPDADRLIFEVAPDLMVQVFRSVFALMGVFALLGAAGFAAMEGRPMAARLEHASD